MSTAQINLPTNAHGFTQSSEDFSFMPLVTYSLHLHQSPVLLHYKSLPSLDLRAGDGAHWKA